MTGRYIRHYMQGVFLRELKMPGMREWREWRQTQLSLGKQIHSLRLVLMMIGNELTNPVGTAPGRSGLACVYMDILS